MPPQFNPLQLEAPHRHAFLIVLAILLILSGIFGVWYFSNPLPQEEPETVVTDSTSSLQAKFADWKTYRNEEYGFEFKYPKELSGFKVYIDKQDGVNSFTFVINVVGTNWISNEWKAFILAIWPKEKWDKEMSFDQPHPIKITESNNLVVTEAKGQDCPSYLNRPNDPSPYCYIYENVEEILSTFKFISTSTPLNTGTSNPTTIDTSNWKTFISEKYNYEFKYPDNVGQLNTEDSSFAGPPQQIEEDMLLISDKEGTFHIQIIDGVLHVIKRSPLGDVIISTFKNLR